MVLTPQSAVSARHNAMLGNRSTDPAKSTKQTTLAFGRPAKRLKRSEPTAEDLRDASPRGKSPSKPTRRSQQEAVIPDSDAESGDEPLERDDPAAHQTDLEQALPPVQTDRQAIEDYEAMRAAGAAELQGLHERLGRQEWVKGKNSIYVDAFNLALETVLEDESHLFDEAEMRVFEDWRALGYEAQYLYVRLFLRKTSAWHRINRLGYYGDIADLTTAVDSLFKVRPLPASSNNDHVTPGELEPPEGTTLGESYSFADNSDDHINSLEEASSLLKLDELKGLAKEVKVQGKNKTELLRAFRRTSGRQTALGFSGLKRSDTEDSEVYSPAPESRDPSPEKREPGTGNRDEHFTRKIMQETGQCIRLSLPAFKLFERVHLVFYRSTEWTEKSLTTIILARIARRNFPDYVVSRSANIFPSRALLLEFEASLRTQFYVDSILEFNGPPTREKLQEVLDIFEAVAPRWKVLLREEQQKEDSIYLSGEGAYLRRLSPAWVYTRLVHKGAYVLGLGKFKDHLREHATLTELLEQKLFHHARRGAWYQRKALLEEHYMHALKPTEGRDPADQKRHWKRTALQTCEMGLQDNLVHVIHHYDLQKRLSKLERQLKIPKRQQHEFAHVHLSKPAERTFEGIRIERQALTVSTSNGTSTNKVAPMRRNSSVDTPAPDTATTATTTATRRPAKTIWVDPAAPDTECSVEAMCLSRYRAQGWKGYHTEGGILRTLFALLFHDILFAYVPHVFQTPFQSAPLDLHTDAFYPARLSEINARCAEIANGRALSILSTAWDLHAARKTCIVGLRWDFAREDIQEIVQAFPGESLSVVMRVLAQEYAQRGGGVPDLFLWKPGTPTSADVSDPPILEADTSYGESQDGKGEVCFAEVKSENDRLSDTQRLWIHVLAGAGIRVEVCHAVAEEVRRGSP